MKNETLKIKLELDLSLINFSKAIDRLNKDFPNVSVGQLYSAKTPIYFIDKIEWLLSINPEEDKKSIVTFQSLKKKINHFTSEKKKLFLKKLYDEISFLIETYNHQIKFFGDFEKEEDENFLVGRDIIESNIKYLENQNIDITMIKKKLIAADESFKILIKNKYHPAQTSLYPPNYFWRNFSK